MGQVRQEEAGRRRTERETIADQHYVDPRGALEKGGWSHVWGARVVQGGVQIAEETCQKSVIAQPNAQETSYRNCENSHGSM